jgi:uncharacterized protein (TIGR02996 family)
VSSRSALLTQILENPADDTARLVLADLLRESDDPADQARGRFLWAGLTAHNFLKQGQTDDPTYLCAVEELGALAGIGYPARWLAELGVGPRPLTKGDWKVRLTENLVEAHIGPYSAVFTRGMMSVLMIDLAEWYDSGEKVLAQWPLERVEINDVPGLGLGFLILRKGNTWEVAAGFRPDLETAEPDPDYWTLRNSYPDRTSMVRWLARDSMDRVYELNDRQAEM